jgi:hypothetical protein
VVYNIQDVTGSVPNIAIRSVVKFQDEILVLFLLYSIGKAFIVTAIYMGSMPNCKPIGLYYNNSQKNTLQWHIVFILFTLYIDGRKKIIFRFDCTAVANCDPEMRSPGNAVLLIPPNNSITMSRHFYNNKNIANNMLLLYYVVKHFFYIPSVVKVWRHNAGHAGARTTLTLMIILQPASH